MRRRPRPVLTAAAVAASVLAGTAVVSGALAGEGTAVARPAEAAPPGVPPLLAPTGPAGGLATVHWPPEPTLPGDSLPTEPVPTPAGPTEPGTGRTVYLTFDDGPSPRWTPLVLDLLERHDAHATFFMLGSQVAGNPGVARRVVEAGHGVGNHTYRHRDLRRLRPRQIRSELRRTQRAIRAATGVRPRCVRPAYGGVDRDVRRAARRLGLRLTLWDVDPRDWASKRPGRVVRSTVRDVRDGSVVLLHDSGGDRRVTLHALARLLHELGARGYRFEALCR